MEIDHLGFAGGGDVAEIREPETYALILAGLACVGSIARRTSARCQHCCRRNDAPPSRASV